MRKTEGVTKYELQWQLLRSSIKGKDNSSESALTSKFTQVKSYFEQSETYDRWERVYNWLEGLRRGFHKKGEFFLNLVESELVYYKSLEPQKQTSVRCENSLSSLLLVGFNERKVLWDDLFKTNKNWLEKGYFHKECNDFLDFLYQSFELKNEIHLLKLNKAYLLELRENKTQIKNSHKFFF